MDAHQPAPEATAAVRRWRLVLFVFVLAVYLLTASGRIQTIDVDQTLQVAASVRSGHGFVVTGPVGPPGGSLVNRKGEHLARHDFGMTLLFLPLTLVPHAVRDGLPTERMSFLASFLDPLAGALAVVVFADLLRVLGIRRRVATVTALLLAFATIAWPYAHVAFDAGPTTLCLLIAVWALARVRSGASPWLLAAGGGAVGFAIALRSDTLFLAPFLTIPAAAEVWRWRAAPRPAAARAAAWAGPIAAGAACNGWYNWARFGSPFDNGLLHDASVRMTTPLLHGVFGLLASPGKGLVFFSPLVVVALLGWPAFARRHRLLAVTVGLMFVAAVLTHARLAIWSGEQAWGPRYLVPVAALLIVPLALALEQALAGARVHRLSLGVIGVVGLAAFGVQLCGVAVDYYAVQANHADIAVEANYSAFAHSQIRYHAEALVDSLRGRPPYPSIGGPHPDHVAPFDLWWLYQLLWRTRVRLAAFGVVLLAAAAGASGVGVAATCRSDAGPAPTG